jgi:hypothetical protein
VGRGRPGDLLLSLSRREPDVTQAEETMALIEESRKQQEQEKVSRISDELLAQFKKCMIDNPTWTAVQFTIDPYYMSGKPSIDLPLLEAAAAAVEKMGFKVKITQPKYRWYHDREYRKKVVGILTILPPKKEEGVPHVDGTYR